MELSETLNLKAVGLFKKAWLQQEQNHRTRAESLQPHEETPAFLVPPLHFPDPEVASNALSRTQSKPLFPFIPRLLFGLAVKSIQAITRQVCGTCYMFPCWAQQDLICNFFTCFQSRANLVRVYGLKGLC